MFCSRCGHQLSDDAKFCPACGQKIRGKEVTNEEETGAKGIAQNQKEEQGYEDETNGAKTDKSEKISWKEYLTIDNTERYAPIAALIPVAMAVIACLMGVLFDWIQVIRPVIKILWFILEAIFVFATIDATVGLAYIAVKKKDVANVHSWITPLGTGMAVVSCFGIAFDWGAIAWIFGSISVILGLEFMARIVIGNQPMDSPFNPTEAFAAYKKYYRDYREKYMTGEASKENGTTSVENSKFDGAGIELLGYALLTILVSAITCGIGAPWMICNIYKWKVQHTLINGRRLTFTGTGGSLLGHWILWEVLTIVTCGIYGFFAHVALRKWELKHTYIEGEPIVANGNESYFDGGSLAYFGYGLLSALLLTITCGLAYPWIMAMLQRWDTSHQVINRRRLVFSGSGLGFLGEYIIIFLLSVLTCGIYAPWASVRMNRYIIRNTNFVN